jgi:flagellar basal-body rod protein FlgB
MKLVEGEAPMFETMNITRMARALSAHAGARLGVIARNVAQADTPGFKAMRLPDFATSYPDESATAMRATRPGHLGAQGGTLTAVLQPTGGEASPNGNTVSVSREMVASVDARQQHDMALAVYRATSEIIRTSLGRR